MSRLSSENFDDPNFDLDFYFIDYPESVTKILSVPLVDLRNWTIDKFESHLSVFVSGRSDIEKWIAIKYSALTISYGLRFKTAKDKLAFTLKYV